MFLALMNISIFYNCYFNHCYKYISIYIVHKFNHCYKYISIYIVHKVQILQIKGDFFQVCYKKNGSIIFGVG